MRNKITQVQDIITSHSYVVNETSTDQFSQNILVNPQLQEIRWENCLDAMISQYILTVIEANIIIDKLNNSKCASGRLLRLKTTQCL